MAFWACKMPKRNFCTKYNWIYNADLTYPKLAFNACKYKTHSPSTLPSIVPSSTNLEQWSKANDYNSTHAWNSTAILLIKAY